MTEKENGPGSQPGTKDRAVNPNNFINVGDNKDFPLITDGMEDETEAINRMV